MLTEIEIKGNIEYLKTMYQKQNIYTSSMSRHLTEFVKTIRKDSEKIMTGCNVKIKTLKGCK